MVAGSYPMASKWVTPAEVEIVRENIVCYLDEGGGEQDMHTFDLIPLRIEHDTGAGTFHHAGLYNCATQNSLSTEASGSTAYLTPSGAAGAAAAATAALLFHQQQQQGTRPDLGKEEDELPNTCSRHHICDDCFKFNLIHFVSFDLLYVENLPPLAEDAETWQELTVI